MCKKRQLHSHDFFFSLLIVAKVWKPDKCPSTDGETNKIQPRYTTDPFIFCQESNPAICKHVGEPGGHHAKWVNPGIGREILSVPWSHLCVWNLRKSNLLEQSRKWLTEVVVGGGGVGRLGDGGRIERLGRGCKLPVLRFQCWGYIQVTEYLAYMRPWAPSPAPHTYTPFHKRVSSRELMFRKEITINNNSSSTQITL